MTLTLVHDADALPLEDQAVLDWLAMMDRRDPGGLLLGCFLSPVIEVDGAMIRVRVSCQEHGDGCWVLAPAGAMEPAALIALAEAVGPCCDTGKSTATP